MKKTNKIRNYLLVPLFVFASEAFAQKSLDFFITQAIQNSPLLKETQNQISQGRIDSLRLKAAYGLQAGAVSNNLFAPVVKGWGYDNVITDGANLSAMVSVSKELSGAQNLKNKYRSFSLQNKSLLNSGKITEQELKKNVSSLYITAFGSWQQYKFNTEMLQLMNKEKDILRKLNETGVTKTTDFLAFMVTLQQQELQADQARNKYQKDLAFLNYLCGINDTSFTVLADPEIKAYNIPDFSGSIFYYQFELDSLKLVCLDREVDLSYQPKISLIADGGYLSSLSVKPYRNFGFSAGLSVNIPVYDGSQRRMQHDRIAIDQMTRANYRDLFHTQFLQQTNLLRQQLNTRKTMEQKISQQIKFSESLVEAYQKLLGSGNIQISEYLLSLGNLLSAKNMLIENTIEIYQIVNELNYWNRTK